jgi:Flp pilus assembly protein TadG
MLPYVTIMLVVLIGLGLLALDGGRALSLQSQLQKAADALALAGAAELDRSAGSRARAISAINNLVANGLAGMEIAGNVQLDHAPSNNDFYSAIPGASQFFTSGTVAPNDATARFVGLQVRAVSKATIFPVTFLGGGTNGYTVGASAVAGMDLVSCKPVPMFICNPFETGGGTPVAGDMIQLQFAGNSQYGPGNFGWLDTTAQGVDYAGAPNACGAGNMVTQGVAQQTAPACGRISNIVTQTGNVANADDGINTRFDLYRASFNGCKGNSLYQPASSVRKGYKPGGSACNPTAPQPGAAGTQLNMGFPVDNNMLSNGLPNSLVTGNGQWSCGNIGTTTTGGNTGNNLNNNFTLGVGSTTGVSQGTPVSQAGTVFGYVATPNMNPSTPPVVTSSAVLITPTVRNFAIDPNLPITFDGYWATNFPGTPIPTDCANGTASRDSIYQREIALASTASLGGESGAPACSTATPNPDRRYIDVAVVNCNAAGPLNGTQSGLHPIAIWKFFLTAPVQSSQGPIFGEYVTTEPPPARGTSFFYDVQLYR